MHHSLQLADNNYLHASKVSSDWKYQYNYTSHISIVFEKNCRVSNHTISIHNTFINKRVHNFRKYGNCLSLLSRDNLAEIFSPSHKWEDDPV